MKHRILTAALALLLLAALTLSVCASDSASLLMDEAGLLTEDQQAQISSLLEQVSTQYGVDVIAVTTPSLGLQTAHSFAEEYYDSHGYGWNGILFLLSMEGRDWYLLPRGYGEEAFNSQGLDYLFNQMSGYLANDDYYSAFYVYASVCNDFLAQAETGVPYFSDTRSQSGMSPLWIVAALVIGLLAALIGTGILKGQLKTVRQQAAAANYVRSGSMNVTLADEIFLNREVSRTAKAQSSGRTGSSGGGSSAGGKGGKF